MIKLRELTPEIYYKSSRDFQFIGRLFDLVLNSVKTEADLLYELPISVNSNEKLLDLLSLSLGFKTNNNRYNTRQLRAICRVFPEILRNKGSIQAVIVACNALFNAEGASQALDYDFEKRGDHTIDYSILNLYVPQEFGDITLLNDLLNYVLPAGMSCNIIREYRIKVDVLTELTFDDTFTIYAQGDAAVPKLSDSSDWNILYDNNKLARIPSIVNSRKASQINVMGITEQGEQIDLLSEDESGEISYIIGDFDGTSSTPTSIDQLSEMTEETSESDRFKNTVYTGDLIRGETRDLPGFLVNSSLYQTALKAEEVAEEKKKYNKLLNDSYHLIRIAENIKNNYEEELQDTTQKQTLVAKINNLNQVINTTNNTYATVEQAKKELDTAVNEVLTLIATDESED